MTALPCALSAPPPAEEGMRPGEAPLSVVMVSASFYPYKGGAEGQALKLSQALKKRGVGVLVYTRRLQEARPFEEIRGVPVYRLWCAGSGVLNAATFMISLGARLWRDRRSYGVIHAHLAGSPAVLCAFAARCLGKKAFVKLGGGKELEISSRTALGRLKLWSLARLDPEFIAVTRELAGEARKFLGSVRVHEIPNGVETGVFRPAGAEDRRRSRDKYRCPEGTGFAFMGRLDPVKNLDFFIEAWRDAVRQSGKKAFLLVAGRGPEEARLKALAMNADASGVPILFLGEVEDAAPVYAAADAFVLPSASEGLSNALLEAMASGLAILASRVGGTAELVKDGENGLLFEPGSRRELSEKIRMILDDPARARRLGERARRAASRLDMEEVARRYELLYRAEPGV